MAGTSGDSVRRVVFLAGFMQDGSAWQPVVDRLAPGWEPVLLDFEADDLDSRLREIRAAAGRGAALVGYSMGGRLALHETVRQPERYRALVTVGASPGLESDSARAERARRDEELAAWMETQPVEAVVARWESIPVLADQPTALVEAQRAERLRHEPRRLARTLRGLGQGALPSLWRSLDRLAELPLLAVAGERDGPYVAAAERLAGTLPLAEAAVVPGAGHSVPLERPAELARLLDAFLGRAWDLC